MLKDVSSHWVRILLTLALGFVVPRLMHAHLGLDGYGTWEIIISLTGFLRLLAMGTPMASVRAVAQYSQEKDSEQLNRAISSSAAILGAVGLMILIVGGLTFVAFELIYVPDVPEHLRSPARLAFILIVFQVAAAFLCQFPFSILGGFRQFVRQNTLKIVAMAIRVAMLTAVLMIHASLIWLALVEVAALFFEFVLPTLAIRKHLPQIRPKPSLIDRSHIRRILSFGGYVLLLNMGIRLAFQTDALVLGAVMSATAVVHYARANTLLIYLVELLVAVGEVIMPTVSAMNAAGEARNLQGLFLRWSKITVGMSMVAAIYITIAGPDFIGWWMNGDRSFVQPAADILPVLCLSTVVFMPARAVALPLLLGLDRPRAATTMFLVAGLVNLALSLVLVGPLGLFGVALGTAIPNAIYAALVVVLACRATELRIASWCTYVMPKSLIGAGVVGFTMAQIAPMMPLQSFIGLAAFGLVTLTVFGVVWVVFVYRNDAHIDLAAAWQQIRRRLSRGPIKK